MNDPRDVELEDPQVVDEIRLVTKLMVVASLAPGDLEQDVIDNALDVTPAHPFLPRQRPRE